ncbi:BCL-6 corepressor-like protein 1 [Lingula anatina]|uniref:BCL-6 corepressor-like protein 1 n=1 Tax=Lingula anatina TaxID=7574 RepID=A0A1S3K5F4_LINAN|nr:BCL-6 corepressor-like protein 1 [Lingula anatina]|eukprot:XP_013417860.1 BCL-6 corepressor-like protein 1 [Lingula anatina]
MAAYRNSLWALLSVGLLLAVRDVTSQGTAVVSTNNGMQILGGTEQPGVTTQAMCTMNCGGNGNCFAIDFDTATTTCYFHTAATACGMLVANANVNHVKLTTCPVPGTGTGGPVLTAALQAILSQLLQAAIAMPNNPIIAPLINLVQALLTGGNVIAPLTALSQAIINLNMTQPALPVIPGLPGFPGIPGFPVLPPVPFPVPPGVPPFFGGNPNVPFRPTQAPITAPSTPSTATTTTTPATTTTTASTLPMFVFTDNPQPLSCLSNCRRLPTSFQSRCQELCMRKRK